MVPIADTSLSSLLATLTSALDSASKTVPSEETALPPKDGISLLDVKNELLLSYLQHLVFLILLKIRKLRSNTDIQEHGNDLRDDAVKKLVALRVYLEKGVRPLESKLKYQIDKVVRAADDAAHSAEQKPERRVKSTAASVRKHAESEGSDAGSGSEGSESGNSDAEIDDLAYRPNPAAFVRPQAQRNVSTKDTAPADGIYRPPRITPTALPTTRGREERERRPEKSATMDEYIATELSTAPVAEPSIGSTIVSGGRRMKSQKEREDEVERQTYEESNFVRLPKESKADKAKKGGRKEGGFGGEEWRNLGAGLDRIDRITQSKGNKKSALDNSRKRAVEDSPRDSGIAPGQQFAKRRKTLVKKGK